MTKIRKDSALHPHTTLRPTAAATRARMVQPVVIEDVARNAAADRAELWLAQVRAAEQSGNMERVAALVQMLRANSARPACNSADPNHELRDAIESGDLAALTNLLASGVDLNALTDGFGMPPLIWAMSANHRSAKVIGALLAHGADARFVSDEGYNPLHFVGGYPWGEETPKELCTIVGLLKKHGARIEGRTHWGWTPLYRAVFEGNTTEVAALLRHGADPNAAPTERAAPGYARAEHMLIAAGHQAGKLRLLLEHGADPRPVIGSFAVKAAQAEMALAERRANGRDARYEAEVVEGYEASLALMRAALARH
ncbi:ankyrin repeat domain-containing protein [Sedimentimonas flavescens]|uniref:ankyrin repeat domain-containing protein n=1 Tax=Sedimentimonas flavescens TaxID=2851012 RepID=UPI001C4A2990|nr:ankyrin repeat domain-containing protein [Sedimentimonas flavescens]MBW0156580.1 hypothetical protein [Sedimentimonas flavescens]